MSKVIVVGAGAAGLMAGIAAAQQGAGVVVLEKMKAPGKKLLITGKGRCNVTNAADIQEILKNIPGNGKFLNGALRRFSNEDLIALLNENGLKTKVERGNRVFPVSDKAKDVVDTLVRILEANGGRLVLNTMVTELCTEDGRITGVKTCDATNMFSADKKSRTPGKTTFVEADAVIVCVGGGSYPTTGSDGKFVKAIEKIGHTVEPLLPALVPVEIEEGFVDQLQGISLRNVRADILSEGQRLGSEFGEMLFTHFGVSGPIILSLSKLVAKAIHEGHTNLELAIDFKPALSLEKLDERVQRDFAQYSNKQVINGMKDLLPQRLLPLLCDYAYLDEAKVVNQVSREERQRLVQALKKYCLPIKGTRPLAEAIVTAGGVRLTEISPKTMESKLVQGLFFAGEVVDVDGYTGGYNLQAAFSSGYTAGTNAAWQ